jgi:hypothetical protein
MKPCVLIVSLVVLLLATVTQAQQSTKELFKRAKTVCVTSPEGPSVDLKAEITRKIAEWGKLTVVSECDKADLIMKVALTRGYSGWKGKGAKGTAEVSDRETSAVLWATTNGGDWVLSGFSNGKVARRMADKFIKDYEKQRK